MVSFTVQNPENYVGTSLVAVVLFEGALGRRAIASAELPIQVRVERFDRRPIEPFELFTSEFGQNSVRIQENSSTIFRKILKFEKFSTFSQVFNEILRKSMKIGAKNDEIDRNVQQQKNAKS